MTDKTEVIFVAGRRGSGKSYFTNQFVKMLDRVIMFDPFGEYDLTPVDDLDNVPDDEGLDLNRISYRPQYLDYDAFDAFCARMMHVKNTYVGFDELNLFTSNYIRQDNFDRLVRTSRRNGTSIIGITQRPTGAPAIILSQSSRLFLFHLHSPLDLKPLRHYLTDEEIERITRLEVGKYIEKVV